MPCRNGSNFRFLKGNFPFPTTPPVNVGPQGPPWRLNLGLHCLCVKGRTPQRASSAVCGLMAVTVTSRPLGKLQPSVPPGRCCKFFIFPPVFI